MTTPSNSQPDAPHTSALRKLVIAGVVLLIVFSLPLYNLVRFSLGSSLYSHIVLIPFISLYLIWNRRSALTSSTTANRVLPVLFFGAGCALLVGLGATRLSGAKLDEVDSLALTTLAFLVFFAGICAWLLGRQILRLIGFPLAFLLFMVPMPTFLVTTIETWLQYGSAAVAHLLFKLADTTVFVDGLSFQLTGITLQIAPECSGIHSSLALLITSVVTGYFLLRSPGKRAVLALAVIPLAVLRNGFRVFVLGELCVHISPEMINSYIHHNGGPIFFVISLIPFFLLLLILVKLERKALLKASDTTPPSTDGLSPSVH
jgi:exosortase C (VPDSG-CTERM-specific)